MSPQVFVHALMASGMGACLFSYLVGRFMCYDESVQVWAVIVGLVLLACEVYMFVKDMEV